MKKAPYYNYKKLLYLKSKDLEKSFDGEQIKAKHQLQKINFEAINLLQKAEKLQISMILSLKNTSFIKIKTLFR